jgi:hypothetical protein
VYVNKLSAGSVVDHKEAVGTVLDADFIRPFLIPETINNLQTTSMMVREEFLLMMKPDSLDEIQYWSLSQRLRISRDFSVSSIFN